MSALKIFINRAEITFALEKEQNAFEVVTGLLAWVNERRLMVSSLSIDNKSYSYPPLSASLKGLPTETLGEIHCEVVNLSTYSATLCLDAGEELVVMGQVLNEKHLQTHIEAISKKLSWIRHALMQSGTLLGLVGTFAPLITMLKELESHLYKIHRNELMFEKAEIDAMIKRIIAQLDDHFLVFQTQALAHDLKSLHTMKADAGYSEQEILAFLANLKRETVPLLETIQTWTTKIATYFQQGKTAPALTLLTDLTNALSLFLTIYHTDNSETSNRSALAHASKSSSLEGLQGGNAGALPRTSVSSEASSGQLSVLKAGKATKATKATKTKAIKVSTTPQNQSARIPVMPKIATSSEKTTEVVPLHAVIPHGVEELEGVLKQIVGAFQENDYVELSDLLEYELSPVLKQLTEPSPSGLATSKGLSDT